MGERRDGLRLPLEPRMRGRIRSERRRQNLDGDLAMQPGIVCPIDLAHPTGAERRQDFVGAQPGTGGQRHVS